MWYERAAALGDADARERAGRLKAALGKDRRGALRRRAAQGDRSAGALRRGAAQGDRSGGGAPRRRAVAERIGQAPRTLEGSILTPGPMVEEIATRWT